MGSEQDLHTPHWHGKTVRDKSRTTDVIELLPGSMVTVDMMADNHGTWLFHCHVADHMEAGMMASSVCVVCGRPNKKDAKGLPVKALVKPKASTLVELVCP